MCIHTKPIMHSTIHTNTNDQTCTAPYAYAQRTKHAQNNYLRYFGFESMMAVVPEPSFRLNFLLRSFFACQFKRVRRVTGTGKDLAMAVTSPYVRSWVGRRITRSYCMTAWYFEHGLLCLGLVFHLFRRPLPFRR